MDGFDKFLSGYITCALWASTGDDDNPLDRDYGPDDIAPEALERMTADCRRFYDAHGELIESIPGEKRCGTDSYGRQSYAWTECAGHDFWLTRNGHGAGFFDGDWPEPAGERLTDASHQFGEVYLYLGDDGLIYLS